VSIVSVTAVAAPPYFIEATSKIPTNGMRFSRAPVRVRPLVTQSVPPPTKNVNPFPENSAKFFSKRKKASKKRFLGG
jgi:hypothetical protein